MYPAAGVRESPGSDSDGEHVEKVLLERTVSVQRETGTSNEAARPARRGRRRAAAVRAGAGGGGGRVVPFVAGLLVGGTAIGIWFGVAAMRAARVPVPKPPDPVTTPAEVYDWTKLPEPAFPIPPYARYLEGVSIVLDPGHGGRADREGWKRGPTGLREAVVNLRVALFLRDFLVAAGAEVVLTRESDVYLDPADAEDLRKRAEIANRRRADLFLSIHHNGAENPDANFTTVFYHESADHSPASLCAARYLLDGLDEALRLEQLTACPLANDTLIARNSGFAVLRLTEGPAVLTESCFHSNPQQEQLLRDPVYNRREAYGLFLGLARWARAGLPRFAISRPAQGAVRRGEKLVLELDDGIRGRAGWGSETFRILADSLVVRLDGEKLAATIARSRHEATVTIPRRAKTGRREMYVDFETVFGQHVLRPRMEVEVR